MKALARSFIWWPGIDHDIESLARNCTTCVNMKNNPPKTDVHHWEWPTTPWQRIHVDYLGPIMGKILFIVVDAHSKWPEVFVVPSTTTENTITCLSSLFARYGYPISLVSDNGPQFTSEDFKSFLRQHGIKHMLSAPYHPATNGQAERYVQTIKRGIKSLAKESGTLQMKVNKFLLQYRKMPNITTGESPASLFLKRHIRTSIDLIVPNLKNFVEHKQNTRRNFKAKIREFRINQKVAVRNYTPEAKWKIGKIIAKEGNLHYRIQVGSNIWKRHVDQITNIGSEIPLSENANMEEHDLQRSPAGVIDPKPVDFQVSATNLQTDDSMIQPTALSSEKTDILNSNTPIDSKNDISANVSVPVTNSSSFSPQVRKSSRIRRAPDRLHY